MESPPREAPAQVRGAFFCWIAVTLIGLIGGLLLTLGAGSALFAGIDEAENESTAVLTAAGVVAIVFGLVQLWLAFRMKAGANWARITLTVLGALSLASMWGGSGGGVFNWVYLVLLVPGIVLMFVPASSAWFIRPAR